MGTACFTRCTRHVIYKNHIIISIETCGKKDKFSLFHYIKAVLVTPCEGHIALVV